MSSLLPTTISFLGELAENNNRPWFSENKDRYVQAHDNVKSFMAEVESELAKHDQIEKSKLFRIYRDVRFSKDKTPYNPHWRMSFTREKPHLRGGYYLHIGPEEAFLAAGFWNPEPKDLALIRGNIAADPDRFKAAVSASSIRKTFGDIYGDAVKTSPKGYDKSHPEIDLLRMKQYLFQKSYDIESVVHPDFAKVVSKSFKAIRPFYDYMSDILSHNLNGEPLY